MNEPRWFRPFFTKEHHIERQTQYTVVSYCGNYRKLIETKPGTIRPLDAPSNCPLCLAAWSEAHKE